MTDIFTEDRTDTRLATVERRPFSSLGHADHGWLNARHHFSFADYHDPARMGWGRIRVWNDDEIGPHSGFPPHPHRDMEIMTYVRTGAITHKDSMGNEGRTAAGDVQVMSAGTGVRHAEYNLEDETTTLFQIWVLPRSAGGAPSWGAKPFPKGDRSGRFAVLASGYDTDGDALRIRADARLLGATVSAGETLTYDVDEGNHAYLVPATGRVEINGETFAARDGAAIRGGGTVVVHALEDSEIVLVDSR
ncbi:pirin family protein [Sphingobium algorifonticola]|uniref:Pirin family protein n=1 Tax=Sphingobium algorifonticola TaxID=2008318 RepID=A0A437JB23_9SPHN|nr:pirin family protein [Sphingobium algorifonticola]RVT43107.1 pirin family protein [Sphingobium algorifonticola]